MMKMFEVGIHALSPPLYKLSQDLLDDGVCHPLGGEHHLHQAGHAAAPGSDYVSHTHSVQQLIKGRTSCSNKTTVPVLFDESDLQSLKNYILYFLLSFFDKTDKRRCVNITGSISLLFLSWLM